MLLKSIGNFATWRLLGIIASSCFIHSVLRTLVVIKNSGKGIKPLSEMLSEAFKGNHTLPHILQSFSEDQKWYL